LWRRHGIKYARIITEAWRDPDWGALIWLAMTTGARRGELAALRWADLDLSEGRESVWSRRAIRKENGKIVEAELKTHQQRRVALDPETVLVLSDHLVRWTARAKALGQLLKPRAYVFSGAPDGSTWPVPDSITRLYERLADRLDVETTFHKLRHYTAAEPIAAGVDVRTVAGRLGHSGGGTTTLRAYTAWVAEADQRAAEGLGSGMPARPVEVDETERQQTSPRRPYEKVAADLRRRILSRRPDELPHYSGNGDCSAPRAVTSSSRRRKWSRFSPRSTGRSRNLRSTRSTGR
jgi:integrase